LIAPLLFLIAFIPSACDDSGTKKPFNINNSNNGECTPGTIECDGWTARTCQADHTWTEEICPVNCVYGEGCVACSEGERYCQEGSVMVCNASHELEFLMDCPEQEACLFGQCVNRCHPSMLTTSNVGCEFWAVDLDNEAVDTMMGSNDAAAQQFAVVIANVNNFPVTAYVYKNVADFGQPVAETAVQPDNGIGMPIQVPARSLVQIDLPQREVDGCMGQNGSYTKYSGSGTFVSSHAYRVVTDGPVVAYQFNPIIQQFSNDASILIPTQALGQHYYVLGYPTANPCSMEMFPQASIPDHTSVTIMGVTPNTIVTVYTTHKILASGGDSGIVVPETAKGGTLTFTIGPFDVVNLESWQLENGDQMECIQAAQENSGDFTGTRIESSAPIAVFSSLERGAGTGGVQIPEPPGWDGETCCTDHLEQQMFPTVALGWNYVISRSPVRSTDGSYKEPDIYRVLATENGTVVNTSLAAPFNSFTLNAGEFEAFYAQEGFTLTATGGAVMVGQFLVSQGLVPGGIGDPSFIVFPAADQHRDSYVFLIPETFQDNYMVVVKPDGTDIILDGTSLGEFPANCTTANIGMLDTTNYAQITCRLEEGIHTIESSNPVGLSVYGYYSVGSYAYPGGSDVKIINPIE
ncbi:IgGFc-binding protein, partial [Myxococcota bacterium]|nr:IgGFc-binding protein [Myxococcota bacterium]